MKYRLNGKGVDRRTFLKGGAALAGAAIGSQVITGFPAILAAEGVTLRYLGTAVNQSADIAKKVKEDTGITIEYIPVTTDDVTRRVITQPNSFDVVDTEYFSLKKIVPTHPHPLVPGTATAQMIAGPWAGMVDRVRDLLAS